MSTQFTPGPTRDVQPGDTPDLNDGQLSRAQTNDNILRGEACYLIGGNVTVATVAASGIGHAPFVPTESVDNSGGVAGDTEMSGITSPQRVALTYRSVGTETLAPGDYLKISSTDGQVTQWLVANAAELKYCRFLGIEAALLDRDSLTPFDETLTPGIVPDQSVTFTAVDELQVIWVQLMESIAGT